MKKNFRETMKLEKFVPGGQVLGVLSDGRKAFVWGVLPGETAEVEIMKAKKNWAEGFAKTILAPAEVREKPKDNCYLSTSPWQILRWKNELREKEKLVREVFRENKIVFRDDENFAKYGEDFSKIDTEIREIATDGKQFGYRNKMEYSLYFMSRAEAEKPENAEFLATFSPEDFSRKYVDHGEEIVGGKIFLAFHRRGSHGKIPILQSSIERPEIFASAQEIVDELNANGENAWKFQSLLMRASRNGEVSGALFENCKPHPKMTNLSDELLGREYSYSPNGFFQINLPVYELALREISRNVGASRKVVDMYSGVGTIGLSLADEKREITLVETDNSAVEEMQKNVENLDENLRRNVKIVHTKSEDALENISRNSVLILDPPRAGLWPSVVEKIREIQPEKVIYLSCNPATQARDVARILGNNEDEFREKSGYKITFAKPFNFFPRTPHIENLVVLERK